MPNPYITGLPWGSGNYPAGASPWSAQPVGVAPSYTFFTPAAALPAEEVNYLLNQRDQAILWINGRLGTYWVVEDLFFCANEFLGAFVAQPSAGWQDAFTYTTASVDNATWRTNTSMVSGGAYQLGALSVATLVGDVIDISFQSTMFYYINAAATLGVNMIVGLSLNLNGAGYGTGSYSSAMWIEGARASATYYFNPVSLSTQYVVTGGNAGTLAVAVNGCSYTNGTFTALGLASNWTCKVRHLRPV